MESARSPHDVERSILEARARALARPVGRDTRGGEQRAVLVFSLGPERLALETRFVRTVTRVERVTRLPGALPHVRGLISVRGRALPLVDLGRLLGRDFDGAQARFAAVLGLDEALAAVTADGVEEVATLHLDERVGTVPPRTHFEVGLFPGSLTLLNGQLLFEHLGGVHRATT
jgi:chemotaxis signal transduction protein